MLEEESNTPTLLESGGAGPRKSCEILTKHGN